VAIWKGFLFTHSNIYKYVLPKNFLQVEPKSQLRMEPDVTISMFEFLSQIFVTSGL
jgi:hypothetical protein